MMNQGQVPSYKGRIQMRRSRKESSLRVTHTGGSDRLENPTKFKFRNRLQAKRSDWVAYSLVKTLALLMLMTLATNAMQVQVLEEPEFKFPLMMRKDKGSVVSGNYELRNVIKNDMELKSSSTQDVDKCFRFENMKNFAWSITDISELVPDPKRKLPRVLLSLNRERNSGKGWFGSRTARNRYLLLDHSGRRFLRFLMKYRKDEPYMQPILDSQHQDFAKRKKLRDLLCGDEKAIRMEMLRFLQNKGTSTDLGHQDHADLLENEFYMKVPTTPEQHPTKEELNALEADVTLKTNVDNQHIFEPKLKKQRGATKWKSTSYEVRQIRAEYINPNNKHQGRYVFRLRKNSSKNTTFNAIVCRIKRVSFLTDKMDKQIEMDRVTLTLGAVHENGSKRHSKTVRNRHMILDNEGLTFLRFLANQPKIYAKFDQRVKDIVNNFRQYIEVGRDSDICEAMHFNKLRLEKEGGDHSSIKFGTVSDRDGPYTDSVFWNSIPGEDSNPSPQLYEPDSDLQAQDTFCYEDTLIAIAGEELYDHLKNVLPKKYTNKGSETMDSEKEEMRFESVTALLDALNENDDKLNNSHIDKELEALQVKMNKKQREVAGLEVIEARNVERHGDSADSEERRNSVTDTLINKRHILDDQEDKQTKLTRRQRDNLYNIRKVLKNFLLNICGEDTYEHPIQDGEIIIAKSVADVYSTNRSRSMLEWAAAHYPYDYKHIYTLDITSGGYTQALSERIASESNDYRSQTKDNYGLLSSKTYIGENCKYMEVASIEKAYGMPEFCKHPDMKLYEADTLQKTKLFKANSMMAVFGAAFHMFNGMFCDMSQEEEDALTIEDHFVGKTAIVTKDKNGQELLVTQRIAVVIKTADLQAQEFTAVNPYRESSLAPKNKPETYTKAQLKFLRIPKGVTPDGHKGTPFVRRLNVLLEDIEANCNTYASIELNQYDYLGFNKGEQKFRKLNQFGPGFEKYNAGQQTLEAKKKAISKIIMNYIPTHAEPSDYYFATMRNCFNMARKAVKPSWCATYIRRNPQYKVVLDVGSGKMALTDSNGKQLKGKKSSNMTHDEINALEDGFKGYLKTIILPILQDKGWMNHQMKVLFTGSYNEGHKQHSETIRAECESYKAILARMHFGEIGHLDQKDERIYGSEHLLSILDPVVPQDCGFVVGVENGQGGSHGCAVRKATQEESLKAMKRIRKHKQMEIPIKSGLIGGWYVYVTDKESGKYGPSEPLTVFAVQGMLEAGAINVDTQVWHNLLCQKYGGHPVPVEKLLKQIQSVRRTSVGTPPALEEKQAEDDLTPTTNPKPNLPVPAQPADNNQAPNSAPEPKNAGDKVTFNHGGKDVEGVIATANEDGTYSVTFDDENGQSQTAEKVQAKDIKVKTGNRRRRLAKLEELLELCRENGYDQ